MTETQDQPATFAGTLIAIAIGAPTLLGVYPVGLALVGLGFGPAGWLATAWQVASMVVWSVLAVPLLQFLRRRIGVNVATGRPALTLRDDAGTVWPPFVVACLVHALTLALASEILMLGRGRPAAPALALDLLLLYAPMNVMTALGLMAAAMVSAEHQARQAETSLRRDLERQLDDARHEVLTALTELNGPAAAPAMVAASDYLDRIAVTTGNRTTLLSIDEIDWIEAQSYYARLHAGQRNFLVRQSMSELERRLDPARFARIHRSTIVNLDRVSELRPFDRRSYLVVLRDGRRLMMSRRRRRLLDFLLP